MARSTRRRAEQRCTPQQMWRSVQSTKVLHEEAQIKIAPHCPPASKGAAYHLKRCRLQNGGASILSRTPPTTRLAVKLSVAVLENAPNPRVQSVRHCNDSRPTCPSGRPRRISETSLRPLHRPTRPEQWIVDDEAERAGGKIEVMLGRLGQLRWPYARVRHF